MGQVARKNKTSHFHVKQKRSFVYNFLVEFCDNTSLHGLSQAMKPVYNAHERRMWFILFIIALGGAAFVSSESWNKFTSQMTSTVVDTSRYPYYNVPFPSVAVCDKSRVDWERALQLAPEDLPEPFNVTKEKTLILLKRLAYVTFGDFDFLDSIRLDNITLEEINAINITDLLLKVMRPCKEVLPEMCWFREKEYDCCTLFELQKTELGFCWAFNSDTSEPSRLVSKGWLLTGRDYWIDANGEIRPRRTGQQGPWSGVRFIAEAMRDSQLPPDGNGTTTGVAIIIGDPRGELHHGYSLVGPGTHGEFPVWGDALIVVPRVRQLDVRTRNCLFADEDPYGLPEGYYLAANCKAACFQNYSIFYCNCTPDFLFPPYNNYGTEFKPCNAEQLLCLSEFNDILTYEIPPISSKFFSDRDGMMCDCPPDCLSQSYITDLVAPQEFNESSQMEVDVHFRLPTCTLYRTDIVYDWIYKIVSIGGIAGLFLGASLTSAFEVLYFLTYRFYNAWRIARSQRITPIKPFIK